MDKSVEILQQIIGLLIIVFTYLKVKAMNDGKLIDKKHCNEMEKLQKEDEVFKSQFKTLAAESDNFKGFMKTATTQIEQALDAIKKTNQKWDDVRKALEGFTEKVKKEAEFTDQKIRKVEDMAMATDKKVEDYRSEIIELGKDVFMIKGKKPNGSND